MVQPIQAAIEDVIRQFSDPLALFRELVQNAIDAGSGEVDIEFEHDAASGLATISISDWGEGMTREIVETRLVRLFSSHKDADFTKIGKFGIGFVSVFALQPDVVCVDTGRDGEWLRVLFHPDRTYDLLELSEPVEGTVVRVIKKLTVGEFEDLRGRARAAIEKWCRFVSIPIYVGGDDIRREFTLDGLLVATFEEEGTRAIAALREDSSCKGAFFHSGLSLQAIPSQYPHVAYMIDSRYLKHTLSRDRVIEDKNFHEANRRLDVLVNEVLRSRSDAALADWPVDPDRRWEWTKLCGVARRAWGPEGVDTIRFPDCRGSVVDLKECRRAHRNGRLFLGHGRPHFAHLLDESFVVLDVRPKSPPAEVLSEKLGERAPILEEHWIQVPQTNRSATPGAQALVIALDRLLRECGSAPLSITFAEFEYPYSGLSKHLAITVDDRGRPFERKHLRRLDPFQHRGHVLLNDDSEVIGEAIEVARHEPEWAAYTLLKLCALQIEAVEDEIFTTEVDLRLAQLAIAVRDARVPAI